MNFNTHPPLSAVVKCPIFEPGTDMTLPRLQFGNHYAMGKMSRISTSGEGGTKICG